MRCASLVLLLGLQLSYASPTSAAPKAPKALTPLKPADARRLSAALRKQDVLWAAGLEREQGKRQQRLSNFMKEYDAARKELGKLTERRIRKCAGDITCIEKAQAQKVREEAKWSPRWYAEQDRASGAGAAAFRAEMYKEYQRRGSRQAAVYARAMAHKISTHIKGQLLEWRGTFTMNAPVEVYPFSNRALLERYLETISPTYSRTSYEINDESTYAVLRFGLKSDNQYFIITMILEVANPHGRVWTGYGSTPGPIFFPDPSSFLSPAALEAAFAALLATSYADRPFIANAFPFLPLSPEDSSGMLPEKFRIFEFSRRDFARSR
jgi:hypothetical protein